jgi:hypothetical protein
LRLIEANLIEIFKNPIFSQKRVTKLTIDTARSTNEQIENMEGVGNNQMWGFTPALDLQQSSVFFIVCLSIFGSPLNASMLHSSLHNCGSAQHFAGWHL